MFKKPLMQPISITIIFFISINLFSLAAALNDEEFSSSVGPVVKKDQRKSLVVTEYGEISVIEIVDGIRGPYHIQFITLEPNSLFLPVLLHADMVFYVHTGSGRLSWVDNEDLKTVDLKQGDIFRLQPGSIFYIESDLETEREKLRIYAIFANPDDEDLHLEPSIGVYSSINDLVLGFGKRTLQAAFKVPEEVIQSITNATERRVIVHAGTKKEENLWELEARYLKAFVGSIENKKKKKDKAYNIRHAKPDFKNCNGWSTTVTKKDTHLLKGSNIGIFMVNLTKGSMMGPHWNPKASEISIVLHGRGMVRVACPSSSTNSTKCKNMRFKVKEGDVFSVTRFHPMAQISFNNDSFVFMGFSTTTGRNHPQFLAGKSSVLRTLDRDVLAVSFNVTNTTIDRLLAPQGDSIILDCTSCAEEEERLMEEEIEKEKEDAREREEEEKKREEEEAREREEEEKKREEEKARKRAEEEARKRAEEEARKRAEEEARKRAEEEARKRAEEEARKRGEKEKRRREEEAEREQEEARKQQQERREKKRREDEGGGEEPGKHEAEAEREQEEAWKQEQGKEKKRSEEEGGGEPRKQDTEAEREQEEARRQQEERKKKRGEEHGGGEPWKEDAAARSEEQEKEWVKMYLKMWKG